MNVYAGQSVRSRQAQPSSAFCGPVAWSLSYTSATQSSLELCPAVPVGLCVGNDPASMPDRFSLPVLLMPTFGKSAAGYQVTVPCFPGATDDQYASPVGVAGLARISGSNDA